jgi:cytochrome c551/c552
MKKALATATVASLLTLILGVVTITQAADGKQIFMDQKCNICHSIESQGIEKKMKKMESPELSNIGAEIESAEWLKGFLLQEKKKDGKQHQRKFKGSDQELDTLVSWIMSLETS